MGPCRPSLGFDAVLTALPADAPLGWRSRALSALSVDPDKTQDEPRDERADCGDADHGTLWRVPWSEVLTEVLTEADRTVGRQFGGITRFEKLPGEERHDEPAQRGAKKGCGCLAVVHARTVPDPSGAPGRASAGRPPHPS